jgi:uncharacterized protein
VIVGATLLFLFVATPPLAGLPSKDWMVQTVAEAKRVYGSGTFVAVQAFRIQELPGLLPLHIAIFPRTLGLMLIGAALWRAGVFHPGSDANRCLPWAGGIGICVGGSMSFLHANGLVGGGPQAQLSFERLATILLASGYGAAIIWGAAQEKARGWLAWAGPIGRMAFTNYLAQSVIFGWLFYGYGLGLFGKLGVAAAFAIGTSVYILQVVFSVIWLRRFRFGPLEWLWRSAMYGEWQPFRNDTTTPAIQ